MADIFISYAREDGAQAERLARTWEDEGFDVWWDLGSLRSGESFNRAIQRALAEARCVVVLWSDASAASKWVESEAYWAWEHDKLFSVRLDDEVPLPVPFNTIHARSLASWDGSADFPEFRQLTLDIASVVGRSPPQASAPTVPAETARQPPEQAPNPPAADRSLLESETRAESEPAARAAPVPPEGRRPRPAVRVLFLAGMATALAAVAYFLGIVIVDNWPGPEPVAESPREEPQEQTWDTESRKGQVPGQADKPRTTFRDAFDRHYPGVLPPAQRSLETIRDCPNCPEMVVIPAGLFKMGCVSGTGCSDHELPVRTVTFDEQFAIGKYEVTFAEYNRFAEATGREKPPYWGPGLGRGKRPVVNVSWDDAQAYAAWLSAQTGRRYRLPTEAEWEYAARGGTATPFSTGECIGTAQANYDGTDGWNDCPETGVKRGDAVEVGSLPANPWGLHEVHGNVREWVADCWHDGYEDAPKDGSAWEAKGGGGCDRRVMRGGSWDDTMVYVRSATRIGFSANVGAYSLGFRLARDL